MVNDQERKWFIIGMIRWYYDTNRTKLVEGTNQIGPAGPGATAPEISVEDIYERYGIDAFVEMEDKGSFVKPDREL